MSSKFRKCELCNSYYKTDKEVHINSIYCKDNNIIENDKIEQHEKACKKLIPKDHKYQSIHELRYNKFYYSQTLTRVICSIPERLTNIEYIHIVKEIKKIKKRFNKYLIKDLVNVIIEYTDHEFEHKIKFMEYNKIPINYLS
jgi:hypothetical protein